MSKMCLSLSEQFSEAWSTESAMKMVNGDKRIPVNVKTTPVRCVHVNTTVWLRIRLHVPQELTLACVRSCLQVRQDYDLKLQWLHSSHLFKFSFGPSCFIFCPSMKSVHRSNCLCLSVGFAAAVWSHPQPVTDHVHSGIFTLTGSSTAGPGNSHQLQV